MTLPEDLRACPQCGSPGDGPYRMGRVCLRCAGNLLYEQGDFGDADVPPGSLQSPAVGTCDGDWDNGDGLPSRIGPYEVIEELGRGGMGRVYTARHVRLGRLAAVKVSIDPGRNPQVEMRFLREAQTAASLRHPNIVTVHDFGRDGRRSYFAMDYLPDGDLARRLRVRRPGPDESAMIGLKLARALAYAHAEGVLHRDLKPSNILMDGDDPRIADFGLAAPLGPGGDLTVVTSILGTPQYLAPEALQRGSAGMTVASDIYALGVILYEMLAGRTPYAEASPANLVQVMTQEGPPSLGSLAPGISQDLETICLKCLDTDPLRRHGDAGALADDLQAYLDGRPISSRRPSGWERFLRWCRRRPTLALLWVAVTALMLGALASVLLLESAHRRTNRALERALNAETTARERLRDARLAEARAVRRSTEPGRRDRALQALREAAQIRGGADVRDEAIAALMTYDLRPAARWKPGGDRPGEITVDGPARRVVFEARDATGKGRELPRLIDWGAADAGRPLLGIPTNAIGPVRFSNAGEWVMERFMDDTLRIWRAGAGGGAPALTLGGRRAPRPDVPSQMFNDDYDFGPDGTWLVAGFPKGLSVHRNPAGEEVSRWTGAETFNVVRASPVGDRVAAVRNSANGEGTLWVFSAPQLSERWKAPLGASPDSLAWSSDGRSIVLTVGGNSVVTYAAEDGRLLDRHVSSLRNPIDATFVGRDALIAMRGAGTTLVLVDAHSGRQEMVVNGIGPSQLGGRGTGGFTTVSLVGEVTRWEIEHPMGLTVLPPPAASGYNLTINNCSLDVGRDGRLMATAHGKYTLVRERVGGRIVCSMDEGEPKGIDLSTVALNASGSGLLRCSTLSGLRFQPLIEAAGGRLEAGPAQVIDPEPGFFLTDRTPDRRRFALVNPSDKDAVVKIVENAGDEFRLVARWTLPFVYCAALSPDGTQVFLNFSGAEISGAGCRLQVRRVRDGLVLMEPAAGVDGEAVWSADGRCVLTSNGQRQSVIWDATTWRARAELTGNLGGNTTTFALSPDGETAVIAQGDRLQLVSTTSGEMFASFESPEAQGMAAAVRFDPDGKAFGVLWHDGRLDRFDVDAIRAASREHGVPW